MAEQGKSAVQQAIQKIMKLQNLTRAEARGVMNEIMEDNSTPTQIGALLTALCMKGETIEEITGFAETMRAKAHAVPTEQTNLLDTCGTGGDGANTINISTTAAIIAAAGGIRVAKHGNRAMSSKSGSADVLEALGVNIQLDQEQAANCLNEVGICFMNAQLYHQSMKYVAVPRRDLGFRTVFNLLGPLTNPAGADCQLMGVYDRNKTETTAHVMKALGVKRALVVASFDGLDEISISDATKVTELKDGEIRSFEITPEDLGLSRYTKEDIVGGDGAKNAGITRDILAGKQGACRDIVLANAGACFYVMGKADSIREGVALAAEIIDSGRALEKLEQLIRWTGEMSHVS